jgi:hypothetical protein
LKTPQKALMYLTDFSKPISGGGVVAVTGAKVMQEWEWGGKIDSCRRRHLPTTRTSIACASAVGLKLALLAAKTVFRGNWVRYSGNLQTYAVSKAYRITLPAQKPLPTQKETRMNRPILMCLLFAAASAALLAQEASQSNPYQGTSNPPGDDEILTDSVNAKPPAGRPADAQPATPAPMRSESEQAQPTSVDPSVNYPPPGGDEGVVRTERQASSGPALSSRANLSDPDGDIVHPRPHRKGEIGEGITIRVKLMHSLSTAYSEKGEEFRSRVATDVVQGDQVLIPAGSEINGRVVDVSSGHSGGIGSMRLKPETVVLSDGRRFHLSAELTGTPGSKTRLGGEGTVEPGSRLKKDGFEYGGAVGTGAVTGAVLGGPVGALTGSLIGAGLVTVHLMVSHPQATLETGTTLLFTLTQPLQMVPAENGGY